MVTKLTAMMMEKYNQIAIVKQECDQIVEQMVARMDVITEYEKRGVGWGYDIEGV